MYSYTWIHIVYFELFLVSCRAYDFREQRTLTDFF